MNQDIFRISIVLSVALLVGYLSDHMALTLFAGYLAYAYWESVLLSRLLKWMRRKRIANAPEAEGLVGAIAMQYEDLRDHHRKQKRRLAS